MDRFMAGNEDSQFIEMSGIVRAAFTNIDRLGVQLETAGYRYRAFSPIPPGINLNTLIGARVRVKGTAAVSLTPPCGISYPSYLCARGFGFCRGRTGRGQSL